MIGQPTCSFISNKDLFKRIFLKVDVQLDGDLTFVYLLVCTCRMLRAPPRASVTCIYIMLHYRGMNHIHIHPHPLTLKQI